MGPVSLDVYILKKWLPGPPEKYSGSSKDLHTYMLKEQRKHTAVKVSQERDGTDLFPFSKRGKKIFFNLIYSFIILLFFFLIKEALLFSHITHFVDSSSTWGAVITGGSRVGIGEPALTGFQGRCQKYRPIPSRSLPIPFMTPVSRWAINSRSAFRPFPKELFL